MYCYFCLKLKKITLETILKSPTVSIVDVRTPAEFMGGHVADSVNIPLNEVPQNLAEFKTMAKPIVLICASGMRSAQATQYLASQGIEQCYNGGSWLVVNGLV